MKTFFLTVSLLLLSIVVFARPVAHWPYDKLNEKADLIAIATPVSTRDTAERTTLLGIQRASTDKIGRPVAAIGVETTFEILSVLKGDKSIKKFLFHHFREAEKQDRQINPPGLVAFDPKEKKRFLLFLKREMDGRYASLTGQTDSVGAIKDLGTYP